jgi:hypothetical protein
MPQYDIREEEVPQKFKSSSVNVATCITASFSQKRASPQAWNTILLGTAAMNGKPAFNEAEGQAQDQAKKEPWKTLSGKREETESGRQFWMLDSRIFDEIAPNCRKSATALNRLQKVRRHRRFVKRIVSGNDRKPSRCHKVIPAILVLVVSNHGTFRQMDIPVNNRPTDAAMTPDIHMRKDDAGVYLRVAVHAYVLR